MDKQLVNLSTRQLVNSLRTKKNRTVGKLLTIKQRRTLDGIIGENLDGLVRFARFRTGNIQDAEDIVHDAIVRLIDRDVSSIKREMLKP